MQRSYYKKYKKQENNLLKSEKLRITKLLNAKEFPDKFELPVTIQLELTQKCNLKCKHCYNNSGTNFQQELMTPEMWKSFAKNVVKNGGVFQVIISGGEPLLLRNDLFEIMDIFHNDNSIFLFITNGFYLDENVIEKLSLYNFLWLQISIDGNSKNIHDDFRGVDGSFEKAINAAFLVSNINIPLVIAHTVTPINLPYLKDMIDLSYQLGASAINIGEVFMSGKALNSNSNLSLNNHEKELLYAIINEYYEKYEGRMEVAISASCYYQLNQYRLYPNSGFIVRPNGDIRLDCMAPFTIGNIIKNDWLDVWRNKGVNVWNNKKVIN